MKRIIFVSIFVVILATSCSGIPPLRKTDLSDKFSGVTVFAAPT